jgi:hypothetical protein
VTQCLCNAGYTGPDGGVCEACSAGSFKSVQGTDACVQCPSNSTSEVGSDNITGCICTQGFTGANGGPCRSCSVGKYKIVKGDAICDKCAVGTYKNTSGYGVCFPCPSGSSSPAGSNSSSACRCLPGYFGGKPPCIACDIGKYQGADGACVDCTTSICSVGQYRETCQEQARTTNALCRNCSARANVVFTSDGGFSDNCQWQCTAGFVQDCRTNVCTRCSAGQLYQVMRDLESSTWSPSCVTCPAGAECDGSEVLVCRETYYWSSVDITIQQNSTTFVVEQQSCKECPEGALICPNSGCFFARQTGTKDGCSNTIQQDTCVQKFDDSTPVLQSAQVSALIPSVSANKPGAQLEKVCENETDVQLVGVWKKDPSTGVAGLRDCPNGYELVSIYSKPEPSSPKAQRCRKCVSRLEYVINSTEHKCQDCPAGLLCHGDSTLEPVVSGSNWTADGAIYRLQSCPSGYYVVPRLTDTFNAVLQKCEPCGKGEQCTDSTCITCFECKAGSYKAAVGTEECLACPQDTFRETEGGRALMDCAICQAKASTLGAVGQSSRRSCTCDSDYYLIINIQDDAETLTCQSCPKGALCGDGKECALRNEGFNCSGHGTDIVGNWSKDPSTGQYQLVSCPRGYETRTSEEAGSDDLQECYKCPSPSTYILRPDKDTCQSCPPGLRCKGDASLQPVTINASWVQDGSVFKLESCPYGHSAVSINDAGVDAAAQQCLPCEKGKECTNPPCTVCFECRAGSYKSSVSTEACEECPVNTFRETPGATDLDLCQSCQLKSSTTSKGQSNRRACTCDSDYYLIIKPEDGTETLLCQSCPKGALCGDSKECALRNDGFNCSGHGADIIGDWSKDPLTGQYQLVSCPGGHETRTSEETGSDELQECYKCPSPSTYILRPDEDTCQSCPPGLRCKGDATLLPVTINSSWVQNGNVFKLETCPYGYSAVSLNDAGVDAAAQQCLPCEKGKECTNPPCTVCFECRAGSYKSSVSTEACEECPVNTFGDVTISPTQSGYCKPCPTGSGTEELMGRKEPSHCVCAQGFYRSDGLCKQCPRGAYCKDGSCAFRDVSAPAVPKVCPDGGEIVGDWEINSEGQFILTACPKGYQKVNDSPETSTCLKCSSNQYIIDDDHSCESCPIGLVCQGDDSYEKVEPLSEWTTDGGVYKLQSCPFGYYKISNENALDQQRCEFCEKGTECTDPPCDESCLSCEPGKYKDIKGTHACRNCISGKYNMKSESTSEADCLQCPPNADTKGDAQTSNTCECKEAFYESSKGDECFVCPTGAKCSNDFCALRHPDKICPDTSKTIVGTWMLEASGRFRIATCPQGYEKRNDVPDTDNCFKCDPELEYILDLAESSSKCQRCPLGLECHGNADVSPKVLGSMWEAEDGVMILRVSECVLSCACAYVHAYMNTYIYYNFLRWPLISLTLSLSRF